MERVETKLSFVNFRPLELQVHVRRLGSIKGFPFEFELGSKLVQKMGSSTKGFKSPMT
jgi:hypothetical protein